MINEINTGRRYGVSGTTKSANPPAASEKSLRETQPGERTKVDAIEIGTKKETSVTYGRASGKRLDATEVASLKSKADAATENLRKLVEQLILKQSKKHGKSAGDSSEDLMTKSGITTEGVEAAKQAISEDGEFGIKAVSDRLVDFAISISGGDKSKLSELVAAIDEGFAAAKKILGGELPDISRQTYDETIRKLNNWANETDS